MKSDPPKPKADTSEVLDRSSQKMMEETLLEWTTRDPGLKTALKAPVEAELSLDQIAVCLLVDSLSREQAVDLVEVGTLERLVEVSAPFFAVTFKSNSLSTLSPQNTPPRGTAEQPFERKAFLATAKQHVAN